MKFKLTLKLIKLRNYLKFSTLQSNLLCFSVNIITYNACSGLRVLLKSKNCENNFLLNHGNAI